jgi:putative heme-binding domain-containing protein
VAGWLRASATRVERVSRDQSRELRLPTRLAVAACGLLLTAAALTTEVRGQAPSGSGSRTAARSGTGSNAAGAELFQTTCKVCHGEAGIGGVGPGLRGAKFTRPYVRRAMSEGRPGSMMPEFTKTFTAQEMNEVAEYVASLQAASAGLRGDPARGETIFYARGARSCYVCHAVAGRGGTIGPELTPKVASLSPRELFQRIIVVPHRTSDPAYATTRLTTRAGLVLTGIKAGETDDMVQFYDTSSLPPILRTIPKKDIVEVDARAKPVMPSDYASRLTLQQLLDIVSFLKSTATDTTVSVTLDDVLK